MRGPRGEPGREVRNAPTGGVDDDYAWLSRAAPIHLSRRIRMTEHMVQQLIEPAGRSPNLPHQHTHNRDAATASEMRTSVMGSDGSAATFSSDGAALSCTS
jgi:hypothetical protein